LNFGIYTGSAANACSTMTTRIGGSAGNPYTETAFMFTPINSIMGGIFFDHLGGDKFGIILDRVSLEQVSAIPLPAAAPLFGSVLAGLAVLRRHRA